MRLIVLIIFLNCYAARVAEAQIKFSIKGQVQNLPNMTNTLKEGDTVTLELTDFSSEKKAVIKNNQFVFDGILSEPSVAMLRFRYGGVKLLLDSSQYSVNIKMKEVGKGKYSYDPTVQTNSDYHKLWDSFYNNYGELNRAKRKLLDRRDLLKNSDSLAIIDKEIKSLNSAIVRNFNVLAIEHPNNFAVPYIIPDAPDFSYDNYINIYSTLTDQVKSSKSGRRLLDQLNAIKNIKSSNETITPTTSSNLIGKTLPNVNTIDEKSQVISLNTALKKKKFTIIEFWASWCSPCRTINISLRGKKEILNKAGVDIIGFSLDNDITNWKKAIKEDNTGWLQLSDLKAQNSQLVKFLSIYNIPSNIVLDSDGKIIRKDLYGDQLDKFLESNAR